MFFLTCKSIAEGPLPFWVQHVVHFRRIYLLKQGKQCERVPLRERVPLPHADVASQNNGSCDCKSSAVIQDNFFIVILFGSGFCTIYRLALLWTTDHCIIRTFMICILHPILFG